MTIDLAEALAWHPALALLLGALLAAVSRGVVRQVFWLAGPLLALWLSAQVPTGTAMTGSFLGYPLELLSGDPLRRLFAILFSVAALAGTLYALGRARWYELCAAQLYAAGALGVAFAGDLITLFLFWELMVIFSAVVIWCGGSEQARAAGLRYALLQLLAGIVLKIGIEATMSHTGSGSLQALSLDHFGAWLILAGILVNAAAPPVSAWLTDAYPQASSSGAVFLSAFTTKSAVLMLIVLFPGTALLSWLGLIMLAYAIVYASRTDELRRVLAYALVGHVGLMLLAVGSGASTAAAALAAAHLLFMPLLFIAAGLLREAGHERLRTLGGSGRSLPLTAAAASIGALSLAGLPLTTGYSGLALLDQDSLSLAQSLLLLAALAGNWVILGLRLPFALYLQPAGGGDSAAAAVDRPARSALLLLATLTVIGGLLPRLLPGLPDATYFSLAAIAGSLLALALGAVLFWLLRERLFREQASWPDTDWLWRVLLFGLASRSLDLINRLDQQLRSTALAALARFTERARGWLATDGIISRSWTIGITALWIVVLLSSYIIIYYLA